MVLFLIVKSRFKKNKKFSIEKILIDNFLKKTKINNINNNIFKSWRKSSHPLKYIGIYLIYLKKANKINTNIIYILISINFIYSR